MPYLSPLCFTSDETFIYAVTFGYEPTSQTPDLIIARSNPYPEALWNTTWTVIATSRNYPPQATVTKDDSYGYNCAWDPQTSSFALSADPLPGFNNGNVPRFHLYIPKLGSAVLTTLDSISNSNVSESGLFSRGRSVLLPAEGNSDENRSWFRVHMNHNSNEMIFTFFNKYMGISEFEQSQVLWAMDASKTGSNHILAHMNSALYALGSTGDALIMSIVPFNSTTGPSLPPAIAQIVTANISQLDCNIYDSRTVMHSYKGELFIMCYQKAPSQASPSTYQIYTFNGTGFTSQGNVSTNFGTSEGIEPWFQFVLVPKRVTGNSSAPSPAISWIYAFSSLKIGFDLNITNNFLSIKLDEGEFFYTDMAYYAEPSGITQPKLSGAGRVFLITFFTISLIAVILFVISVIRVRRRKPVTQEEYELNDTLPSYAAATDTAPAPAYSSQRN
ncbi:hypothetical protein BGX27_006174 [Mortierella sp. AM989]|nr:hypothetical protein BGX27_006174 [Mortierella sp. AM989]